MNKTRLILYDNESEVRYEVDLYDSEPIQLTKQVFDVENPDERVADFTRTIRAPATHNNNKIFSHYFDLNRFTINETGVQFNDDFNVTYKANAILLVDNVQHASGYVQLTNVLQLPDGSSEYELIFIGEVKNIFNELGEKVLSDIDLSDFDHTLDADTITGTWNATRDWEDGYVYPLIDYGHSTNKTDFRVEHFAPAVYLKQLVDRIFSEAGFSYQSDFFNSEYFKKIIIPFSGDKLRMSDAVASDRTAVVGFNSDVTLSSYNASKPNIFNLNNYLLIQFNNIYKNFNPPTINVSNNRIDFGSSSKGKYSVGFDLKLRFTTPNNTGGYSYDGYYTINVLALLYDSSNNFVNSWAKSETYLFTQNTTVDINLFFESDIYRYVQNGYYIRFLFREIYFMPLSGAPSWLQLPITFKSGSKFKVFPQTELNYEGAPINLSDTLSKEVKQSELLLWLVKMFNLYIEPDKFEKRKLIIEPRNDFFTDEVKDWTNKVDYSNEIKISPIKLSRYKDYVFEYAKDEDWINSIYDKGKQYTYGHRTFEVVNDFTNEKKEVKIGFAPTPLIRWNDRPYPISSIYYVNNDGTRQDKSAKIRILFYKFTQFTDVPPIFRLVSNQYGTQDMYVYPYAGHIDDWTLPEHDLCYGMPDVLYYNAEIYTNGNLFNEYWIEYIRSIIDPDSKIVEMHLRLNEVDIINLSFRHKYLIDRQYYLLQSVEYDLVNSGVAKCVFLKLVGRYKFEKEQIQISGGIGNTGGIAIEDFPQRGKMLPINGNEYDKTIGNATFNAVVSGKDNQTSASGFLNGANNIVFSENSNLFNTHNSVVLHNDVSFINCNEYQSSIDGETAINNCQYPFTARVVLTPSQLSTLHTTPITLVEDTFDYIVEFVSGYAINHFNTDAYNSHNIRIKRSDGVNIATFTNSFVSSTSLCLQNAKVIDDPIYNKNGFVIDATGNLGAGDGKIEIVIQYRLIKI